MNLPFGDCAIYFDREVCSCDGKKPQGTSSLTSNLQIDPQDDPCHQLQVGAHNSTYRGEIATVTHLFSAIYEGYNTPFVTWGWK